MTLEIVTNNHWRPFKFAYTMPVEVLLNQFDYLGNSDQEGINKAKEALADGRPEDALGAFLEASKDWGGLDGYFSYKGHWYHTSGFTHAPKEVFGGKWSGYAGDSFFSGVLIELADDGEEYRVGTYIS